MTLSGRYSTFEALVGFDDASKGKGRVDCRVVADGKELYANPDLRADGPPVKLKLPVAGAEQLRLRRGFRSRSGYGRPRDLGERPPLSPITVEDVPRQVPPPEVIPLRSLPRRSEAAERCERESKDEPIHAKASLQDSQGCRSRSRLTLCVLVPHVGI